jgi:iron(III) transport system substrate-binding protein
MKRKLTWRISLFVLLGSLFVASQPANAQDVALLEASKKEGSVNWYGAWPKSLMQEVANAFEAKNPGVKVNLFRSGSSKVAAKIDAENKGGKILADVMTITEESIFKSFKKRGYLEAYKPPGFDKFAPKYRDADGYWVTPRIVSVGLWYNVERLKKLGLPVPTSWHDLTNPVYQGEIVMGSPLYSGTWSSLVGAFSQKKGFGWEFFEKMADNDPLLIPDNPDIARAVAAGERTVAAAITGYISIHPVYPKGSVKIVNPKEGMLVIQSSSGLVANRPHKNSGKLLQAFLASADAGNIIRNAKYSTGRMDIGPPDGMPKADPAIFPDAEWIGKNKQNIRRKWAEITKSWKKRPKKKKKKK